MKHRVCLSIMAICLMQMSTLSWSSPRLGAKFSIDLPEAWVQRAETGIGEVKFDSPATRESLSVFVAEMEPDARRVMHDQAAFERMVQVERDGVARQAGAAAPAAVTQPVFGPMQGYYMTYSPSDGRRVFRLMAMNTRHLSIFWYEAIGLSEDEFISKAKSLAAALKVQDD